MKQSYLKSKSKCVIWFLKTRTSSNYKGIRIDVTGLPVPIWLQPKTGKEKHGPRIKVAESKRMGHRWAGCVTIEREPRTLNWMKRVKAKVYVDFVKRNYDLLKKYWDGEISTEELENELKKRNTIKK